MNVILVILLLIVVVVMLNVLKWEFIVLLLIGIFFILFINFKYYKMFIFFINEGVKGFVMVVINMSVVVGFGLVIIVVSEFKDVMYVLLNILSNLFVLEVLSV